MSRKVVGGGPELLSVGDLGGALQERHQFTAMEDFIGTYMRTRTRSVARFPPKSLWAVLVSSRHIRHQVRHGRRLHLYP